MKSLVKYFIFTAVLSPSFLWSTDKSTDTQALDPCESKLNPAPKKEEILLHPNSYAPNADLYQKTLEQVQDIALRLGLLDKVDRHVLEILAPKAVAGLAAVNRYPVGSYMDGATIAQQAPQLGGVLEFVLSGKDTQHSYYLSTLDLDEFISIVIHVYGHNFFHVHSHYPHKVAEDRVQASIDLDHLMSEMSKRAHPNEVEDWYFQLLSIENAQDYWSGTYETPETIKQVTQQDYRAFEDDIIKPSSRQPKKTESLLQAFVAELPASTPAWKVEMAKRIERMHRFAPGAVNTKVVNEGFATICQYILFEHLPEHLRGFPQMAELGNMMAGVTYPQKRNPYFLGVEIWKAVRKEFNSRPEIRQLSAFERDKAFFAYAKTIIGNPNLGNNLPFIHSKLPNDWITNQHLALVKKFSQLEQFEATSNGKAPEPPSWDSKLYQVITHNPDRIRRSFMDDWNFHRVYPFVTWTNYLTDDDDTARFEVGNDIGLVSPINRQSLGPTLMMWAKTLQKKVELEATLLVEARRGPWGQRSPNGGYLTYEDVLVGNGISGYILVRATITADTKGHLGVNPLKLIEIKDKGGKYLRDDDQDYKVLTTPGFVKISDIDPDRPLYREIKEEQEAVLQAYLKAFVDDYNLDRTETTGNKLVDLSENSKQSRQQDLSARAVSATTNPIASELSLTDVPPGILRALTAYEHKVAGRFLAAFYRSLKGRPLTPSAGGVRLKVLPSPPGLSFDFAAKTKIGKILSEVDHPNNPYSLDERLIFTSNPAPDNTYYWVEPPKPGENGDGNGEGEGDESEEPGSDEEGDGEQSQDPNQGTGGSHDPTYIDVPLDLYAKLMQEEIELPNLRPLEGDSERMSKVPAGSQVGDYKPIVAKRTAKSIIALGVAKILQDKEDGKETDHLDPLEEGLPYAGKNNIYSKKIEQLPDPDINAHITIVADNSGSMSEELPKLRNMIFNLRMILKNQYKSVVFTYIAFDGKAHVFEDHEEDKFFKVRLGGGTDYYIGSKAAADAQAKFPETVYDRFVFVFGDLYESHSPRITDITKQLMKQSRFFGVVKFPFGFSDPDSSTGPLENFYRSLPQKDPYAGFTAIAPGPDFDVVATFKSLFRTQEDKQPK